MHSTADNLMMNAKGFAMSAQTLLSTGDDRHDLTILHLVCVSVELSFKACIKHEGGTEADLRKISHHLDRAYGKSLKLSIQDRVGKLKRAVDIIAPVYGLDYARYFPDIDGFVMLSTSALVGVAKDLAIAVEDCVWPDNARAIAQKAGKPPPQ